MSSGSARWAWWSRPWLWRGEFFGALPFREFLGLLSPRKLFRLGAGGGFFGLPACQFLRLALLFLFFQLRLPACLFLSQPQFFLLPQLVLTVCFVGAADRFFLFALQGLLPCELSLTPCGCLGLPARVLLRLSLCFQFTRFALSTRGFFQALRFLGPSLFGFTRDARSFVGTLLLRILLFAGDCRLPCLFIAILLLEFDGRAGSKVGGFLGTLCCVRIPGLLCGGFLRSTLFFLAARGFVRSTVGGSVCNNFGRRRGSRLGLLGRLLDRRGIVFRFSL